MIANLFGEGGWGIILAAGKDQPTVYPTGKGLTQGERNQAFANAPRNTKGGRIVGDINHMEGARLETNSVTVMGHTEP